MFLSSDLQRQRASGRSIVSLRLPLGATTEKNIRQGAPPRPSGWTTRPARFLTIVLYVSGGYFQPADFAEMRSIHGLRSLPEGNDSNR